MSCFYRVSRKGCSRGALWKIHCCWTNSAADSVLEMQDQRVARERMLLRSAAAAANSSFIVSYPRMDVAQARARVPSFYALEVVRAAEGRLPSLREFEKRAAASAPARLDWPAPADPREAIDDAEYDLCLASSDL